MHNRRLAAVAAGIAWLIAAPALGQATTSTSDPKPADGASPASSVSSQTATTAPAAATIASAPAQTTSAQDNTAASPTTETATTTRAATAVTNGAATATNASQAAPTASGPSVAWVKHVKPPQLMDDIAGLSAIGMIGAVAEISSGKHIVEADNIEDPSRELAETLAASWAAAHGGQVADAPILTDKEMLRASAETLAKNAAGARYVVDVDPPGMTLIYFSFDWTHYDLMYLDFVRVIDVPSNKVVATGRCFIKTEKQGAATHDALIADDGALLKQVIARKADACLIKLKEDLKLPT
jgi:hypothetical protein